ncbi:MAG TPA: protoporphyrinogen oxidase [Candidatus Polarisedimenticolia bacterium]|nr:protoporphyrinogen oxidase [Candidatus Polarisedimenticolia bacterium]
MKKVIIVGGGISGLSTAFYLRRARPDVGIVLFEGRSRLGGVITTCRRDGFVIEGGPDSFVTAKPWGVQLCRDLGIESRLIPTDPAHRKTYVLSRGRLEPLPPGLMLAAPTRLGPFLRSSLISWPGKIRMGMDLLLPRGRVQEDESLGSFVGRRLGREAVDKIAEPILGGIFLAEADHLSLRSTFPSLLEMELRHRSLILAMRRQQKPARNGSAFLSLSGGMSELVEVLRAAIPGVDFRIGSRVLEIQKPLRIRTEAETLEADALVLAVPPPECSLLLRGFSSQLADRVAEIPSLSSATVSLAYRDPKAAVPLDGTGFVIARGERRRILACTWSSKKFAGRAPEGHLLLRCFMGGKNEAILEADDVMLVRIAREELREIMGLPEDPMFSTVFRWPAANPIYGIGHEARVRRIEGLLDPAWNLHLSGSGFRGVGIPDCVRQGLRVAVEIARSF